MSVNPTDFEALRIALMQVYSSQTITHAGYVIALTVGLLTIVSRWKDVWSYCKESSFRKVILLLILSATFGLVLYFSLRVVYWATLSDQVLLIPASDIEIGGKYPTYISALQGLALDKIRLYSGKNPLLYFAWLTNIFSYQLFVIIFVICFLIIGTFLWKGGCVSGKLRQGLIKAKSKLDP